MSFNFHIIVSFSISIAALIAAFRYRCVSSLYYPFIYLLWIGLICEFVSYLIIRNGYSNAVVYNVYSLLEALFISMQFKYWGIIKNQRKLLIYISGIAIIWLADSFVYSSIREFNSFFIIYSSFGIVLLSILGLTDRFFSAKREAWRDPMLLICAAFSVYFLCSMLVESFWFYGISGSIDFRSRVYEILSIINLISNLVFAIAILWMPMKARYILQW